MVLMRTSLKAQQKSFFNPMFYHLLFIILFIACSQTKLQGDSYSYESDQKVIMKVFNGYDDEFTDCGLENEGQKVFLNFIILSNGQTHSSEVSGKLNEKTADCILKVVNDMKFPATTSGRALELKLTLDPK